MKPRVLIAETSDTQYLARIREMGWGRMFCFKPVRPFEGEPWGFDNGAFKVWQDAGFPANLSGDDWCILFDADEFKRRLDAAMWCGSVPYLAVVPDIVGSADSLEYSLSWLGELPREWPWYLAVQDGMEVDEVDSVLQRFDGIFLGGTDKFKLQAWRWRQLAHRARKKFHYGRAGTLRKVRHAIRIGANSLDSSFPLWTRERFSVFADVWNADERQSEIAYA